MSGSLRIGHAVDCGRRLLAWGPGLDGRAIVVAALVIYFGGIAAGRVLWEVDLWPFLGVPSGPSLFFDARNLTAAWECDRLGYDPLYESPCDPRGRPLNYPRIWLLLGTLGLDQSHTSALAALLVTVMFLSWLLLIGRVPAGTGILLALAACSPAVMLAVERANMDVALFSILAAAVLVWRAIPGPAAVLAPGLVLVAAAAKVYAVFALPAFLLTRNRVAARSAACCLAAFAAYAAFNHRDILHIARIAPQGELYSYGARILPAHVYHQFGAERWAAPAVLKQAVAVLPFALVMTAAALWIRRRRSAVLVSEPAGTPPLLALHLGTFIYLGTFAAGNNFDYRLVFLLLTLPQLLEWIRTPGHRLSELGAAALTSVVVLLWAGSLSRTLSLWDELASWAAAGLLAAAGVAASPAVTARRTPADLLQSAATAATGPGS